MSDETLPSPHAPRAQFVTTGELAARWRVSTRTLERWRAEVYGPTWTSIGGSVRYANADVEAWEARGRRGPAEGPS